MPVRYTDTPPIPIGTTTTYRQTAIDSSRCIEVKARHGGVVLNGDVVDVCQQREAVLRALQRLVAQDNDVPAHTRQTGERVGEGLHIGVIADSQISSNIAQCRLWTDDHRFVEADREEAGDGREIERLNRR